jgi:hypothetical protein
VVREEWAAHGEQKAAAVLVLAGAVEDRARVRENEIDHVGEHQWVMAVLWEHWIGAERQQRQLSTVARRGGGGPVRDRARGRGNAVA